MTQEIDYSFCSFLFDFSILFYYSRCLIFGTDGLWNMISSEGAVSLVQATERHNEAALVGGNGSQPRDWLNPSKSLVDHALER